MADSDTDGGEIAAAAAKLGISAEAVRTYLDAGLGKRASGVERSLHTTIKPIGFGVQPGLQLLLLPQQGRAARPEREPAHQRRTPGALRRRVHRGAGRTGDCLHLARRGADVARPALLSQGGRAPAQALPAGAPHRQRSPDEWHALERRVGRVPVGERVRGRVEHRRARRASRRLPPHQEGPTELRRRAGGGPGAGDVTASHAARSRRSIARTPSSLSPCTGS